MTVKITLKIITTQEEGVGWWLKMRFDNKENCFVLKSWKLWNFRFKLEGYKAVSLYVIKGCNPATV